MFRHRISSTPVEIDAPVQRVWAILMDVDRYGEWNPFTTRVETDLEIGSPVDLHVTLGPIKVVQPERIETVDPPRLLAWGTKMGHPVLLSARREQHLAPLGESRCRYTTNDDFSGFLTPLVMLIFGALIRRGFNEMADALKERSEATVC